MTAKMSANEPGRIEAAFRGSLGGFSLDASFSVPATGVTAIFGASGCGKTTVARCLAGLQYLPGSFFAIDGEVWQDQTIFRKAHQRPVGYVFQEASLFSHLSVKRNLLYGAPRHASAPGPDGIGFDETIELLGLAKLLDRSPQNLSGGERQRVAIGRALLSQPKLLLMDEPLSALDRPTRDEILPFLERLHQRLSLPVIYISHDMTEIERLADQLVLMQNGKVIGAGPLQVLQSDPALPLAGAREAAISLDATVEAYDASYGLLTLQFEGGRLLVPAPAVAIGERQRLRISASDVSLARSAPQSSSILNVLPARIVSKSMLGHGEVIAVLALGADGRGTRLLARITLRSWDLLGLAEQMLVFAQVKGVSLVSGVDGAASHDTGSRAIVIENSPGIAAPPEAGAGLAETAGWEQSVGSSMRGAMTADFQDINPNHLAAILYRPEDDVDALLADFADGLLRDGERIGGVVQRNLKDEAGRPNGMHVIDLSTGRNISICQPLGSGATACKLDPAGLAEASVAVARAVAEDAALIIVNKFSKQEAAGHGLRSELAEAIVAGLPVLTAVPEKCFDAWRDFTGDLGTVLLCERHVVEQWWREVSLRRTGARAAMQPAAPSESIFRSSHPTT
jgi:molybdate transport system ATP-binding protein